jgi:hypothetical protein
VELEELLVVDLQAHLSPCDHSTKDLTCTRCGATFVAIHDFVLHSMSEKMHGVRVPAIVPDETALEDWMQNP